jgi:SAM-dependent methyltransferase
VTSDTTPLDYSAWTRSRLGRVTERLEAVAEIGRVLRPGGRVIIGELGRWSSWAALRRIRGWLGSPTWRDTRFWTSAGLRRLASGAGLSPGHVRGAVFYPPLGLVAAALASLDPVLGRGTTIGAAFLAMSATKPEQRGDALARPLGSRAT